MSKYTDSYGELMEWVCKWVDIPEHGDLVGLDIHLDKDGRITVSPKLRFIEGAE